MTFKECRKYGRKIIYESNCSYGFMYKDRQGEWYFDVEQLNECDLKFVLEKNGVVHKVVNGHWIRRSDSE